VLARISGRWWWTATSGKSTRAIPASRWEWLRSPSSRGLGGASLRKTRAGVSRATSPARWATRGEGRFSWTRW
jgi:hypothetical protein